MRAFALGDMQYSMLRNLLLLLGTCLVMLPRPALSQQVHAIGGEGVTVFYEEPLRVGAENAARIYPLVKRDLEKLFKLKITFKTRVFLIKQDRTFHRMVQHPLIVAFAVPNKDLIVMDYPKVSSDPFSIETTMKHELCHLVLHHHVGRGFLPKWLDEGIAQWASGGIAEIIRGNKKAYLNKAIMRGRLIRMESLDLRFPADNDSLLLAYEETESIVSYIVQRFGVEGLLRILDNLSQGYEWREATSKALSTPFAELEADWQRSLKKRLTWLSYLIDNLYEILFIFGALVVVYAFVKILIRKRVYMREHED